ncbi:MAG: 50S ribosomal protein L4 [Magnetospiraceae bacterium]
MKTDVISLNNEKVGDVDLDEAVFGLDVRADILHRMVTYQLAKRRAGTHQVKERSDVNGARTKPFKQKGTGHARQGFKRAAQMRGGGIVHGPRSRDHGFSLNKKVRKLALKTALSSKVAEGKLVILDTGALESPKTKDLAKQLAALGWTSALIVDGPAVNENMAKAARNIIGLDVLPQQGANVYDILRRDTLVLTRDAVEKLVERLK